MKKILWIVLTAVCLSVLVIVAPKAHAASNTVVVTYIGDYVGTDTVQYGSDVTLPSQAGKLFAFEMNGACWTGRSVTQDVTVEVFSLTPFSHNAKAGWCCKNNILRIGGTGTMKENCSGISAPWYDDRTRVREVRIHDGITNIGEYAFDSFPNLLSATIGESVETIGQEAFDDCPTLQSIRIPDSVKSIGMHAFEDCYALTSVTIGSGLETLGRRAFRYNETAAYVISEDNPYFKTVDGNIFSKDGTTLVRYAIAKTDTAYVIPEGVTTIADDAFESAVSLKTVTIPTSVKSIGDSAFWLVDSYLKRHYLTTVYYQGNPVQWKAVSKRSYNYALEEAEMQFASYCPVVSAKQEKTTDGYLFDIVLDQTSIKHLENVALIIALYDGSGRFLGLTQTAALAEDVSLSVPVETAKTAARALVISLFDGETAVPVCEALPVAIQ